MERDISVVPGMPISMPFYASMAADGGMKHVVVTRGNHVAGVVRVNTGLRRGIEAAYAGVSLGDVAQHNFTLARENDIVFDILQRMARHDASMAVVTRTGGRWRPSEIVGVISKEHVADLSPKASSHSANDDGKAAKMNGKTVLISRIGIGGPTLAFWLKAAGFSPTLVERSPALRTGGYVIDFWGLGYDIAERMGLSSDIDRIGYHMRELRMVDGRGNRVAGFGTAVFSELTGGRYVTLGRSDLSRLIVDKIKDTCEILFGDEIESLRDQSNGVDVRLKRGGDRRFDLVIGADGLHSNVRRLVFGSQDRFEKKLGYMVAAFEVKGYSPRDEEVYVVYGKPGRQLGRFALHNDRTLFLLVFAGNFDTSGDRLDLAAQKAILRERFDDGNWECGRILDELDRTQELYFDRVSQIVMDTWSSGRVALVGDAAFCISLLGGQGSALAMTAAYVLAGELSKSEGRHKDAFRSYEELLRTYITAKQRSAERFAGFFAPKTKLGLILRKQVIRAFRIPGLARYAIGKDVIDKLQLPDYGLAARNASAC